MNIERKVLKRHQGSRYFKECLRVFRSFNELQRPSYRAHYLSICAGFR
jgi:hypothetical protein